MTIYDFGELQPGLAQWHPHRPPGHRPMTVTCPARPRLAADRPSPVCEACGATGLTQTCGRCGRALCPACYGEWLGLSCAACRKDAAVFDLARLCATTGLGVSELGGYLRWSGSTTLSAHLYGLDLWHADAAAVAFGLHPALVWPEWFDEVA